jgi:hypothetical protein
MLFGRTDPDMAVKRKRRPDMRRVRPTKTYSIGEIAAALDRDPATVGRWVRSGLPTIDAARPVRIHGSDLKAWLDHRWNDPARKCGPAEIYCLSCRQPRRPLPGSVQVVPMNARTLRIGALCGDCQGRMSKLASAATASVWAGELRMIERRKQNLIGSTAPNDNVAKSR